MNALKSAKVAGGAALDEPQGVADRFDRAVRLDGELQADPDPVIAQGDEGHDATVPGAIGRGPGDPLVRDAAR